MCRIAAYLGPDITLDAFFRAPEHSLYRQSWAPREMLTATVNADGYGVAWLDGDNTPAVYRSSQPAWADINLAGLSRSLTSRLWLGNVRSATAGQGTHPLNTQPFVSERLLFTHNGFIGEFAHSLRRAFRKSLDAPIEAGIEGNTDSEYLFAYIRQHNGPLLQALSACINQVHAWIGSSDIQALLNIIVSDGECLYASRAAVNAQCPSLYFHAAHPALAGGAVVASEPFDGDPGWQTVPEQHRLTLSANQARCEPL